MRAALDVEAESLTPSELMSAILRAPVDLLWNGGIGTYVKAKSETHADVGDKANDALRVNGGELRAKVVGEGGNLGFTQRGRIEFALSGGKVNTDAIDNAGGVNCSDHEVNIKVLLDTVVAEGDMTVKQRNALLAEMTDAVAERVLRGSYTQTQSLSLARVQAPAMLDVHDRVMRDLEAAGRLDRALEALPDAEAVAERRTAGLGLTQPELAVMLAYSKILLYASLLDSDLPEDPALDGELDRYFPSPLPERFGDVMRRHRLKREIVATRVTNDLIDRAGTTFVFRLREDTGASMADIARASVVARDVFAVRSLWADVEALDGSVPAETQYDMLLSSRRMVERSTRWLLRSRPRPLDIAAERERYGEGAATVAGAAPGRARRVRAGELARARRPAHRRGRARRRWPGAWRRRARSSPRSTSSTSRSPPSSRSRRSRRCTSRSAATCTCTGCATGSRCWRATRAGRRWRARRCATTSSACTPSSRPTCCAPAASTPGWSARRPRSSARRRSSARSAPAAPSTSRHCRWRCARCAT